MLDEKTMFKDFLKSKTMFTLFWAGIWVGFCTIAYFYGDTIRYKYVKGHETEASLIFYAILILIVVFQQLIWSPSYTHDNEFDQSTFKSRMDDLDVDMSIRLEKEKAYIEHIYKLKKLEIQYEEDHLFVLSRAVREQIEVERMKHGSDLGIESLDRNMRIKHIA